MIDKRLTQFCVVISMVVGALSTGVGSDLIRGGCPLDYKAVAPKCTTPVSPTVPCVEDYPDVAPANPLTGALQYTKTKGPVCDKTGTCTPIAVPDTTKFNCP